MSYNNKYSSKPFERASKTAHTNIINDPEVLRFISSCTFPPLADEIDSSDFIFSNLDESLANPIKHIFTIDGGYTNEIVRHQFPSATFAFLQFGALLFSYKDLVELELKPFIDPSDMSKLQRIERFKLSIPTKGITLKSEKDLISSVRKSIYDFFFKHPSEQGGLIAALDWLVFGKYDTIACDYVYNIEHCPLCDNSIAINKCMVSVDYTIKCPDCKGVLFLTDILRLHEAMDNELGAGGILGYLTTAIEQMIVVYLIKLILSKKPELLSETLFIKDGPLAFFGLTYRVQKPMQRLIRYLHKKHNIYLVGLEKSGLFAEHAAQASQNFSNNQFMVLGNKYIYKYILPGKSEENTPYASTTYYGHKVIFKSKDDYIYVATVPCPSLSVEPRPSDLKNLEIILHNVAALKCDLYSSSLIPVVLANKLVSLASHPSSDLLRAFVQDNLGRGDKT